MAQTLEAYFFNNILFNWKQIFDEQLSHGI